MRLRTAALRGSLVGLLALGLASAAGAQVTYQPGPANPGPSNESASGTGIPTIQIQVGMTGTEGAVIQSLTIGNQGTLHDVNDITAVHLWVDVNANGWVDAGDIPLKANQTFSADDGTVVFGSLNRTIGAGQSECWLMVTDLSGNATAGTQFTSHLGTSVTLTAVGATSGNTLTVTGTSVNSGAKKIDPAHCTLTIAGGAVVQPAGSAVSGGTAVPIALLELRASTAQGVQVTSVTFTASGTGNDLTEVNQVRLFLDTNGDRALQLASDPEIGASGVTYNMDDGTAVFSTITVNVPAGGRAMLILAYDFATTAQVGGTFGVAVANSSDITRCGTAMGHTCTTTSCQLHGTPTTHAPTTLQAPTTTTTTTTTDPTKPKAREHTPSYCCAVVPVLAGGGGGGAGGFGAGLMLWWPLLGLAAICWSLRDRRRLAAVRRRTR